MGSESRRGDGGGGKLVIILSSLLISLINLCSGSPIYMQNSQIGHFQSGRNIRHLPCVVKKSGLEGVCMFAIDCLKSNGTHLGTCIDRFYFGSCCLIKDDSLIVEQEISDNSIDQNTISHFSNYPSTVIVSNTAIKSSSSTTERPQTLPASTVSITSSSHSTLSSIKPSSLTPSNTTFELISSSTSVPKITSTPISTSTSSPTTTPKTTKISTTTTTTTAATSTSTSLHSFNQKFNTSNDNATTKYEDMEISETTQQTVKTTLKPQKIDIPTTFNPTTMENYKLSTFQTINYDDRIDEDEITSTTARASSSAKPVRKTTARPTQRPSSRPTITTTTTTSTTSQSTKKPVRTTSTTNRPRPKPSNSTRKPTVTPTRRPVTLPEITLQPGDVIPTRPRPTRRPTATTERITSTRPASSPTRPSSTKPSATSGRPNSAQTRPATTRPSSTTPGRKPTTKTTTTQKPSTPTRISTSTSAKTRPTTKTTTVKTSTQGVSTAEPLTTISFVQSTKAPRPKPKPTSQITIVEPTTLDHLIELEEIATKLTTTKTTVLSTTKSTRRPTTPSVSTTSQTTKLPSTESTQQRPASEPTTLRPGLVTWTNVADGNKNGSGVKPDWVLIPVLTTETATNRINLTTLLFDEDESKITTINVSSFSAPPTKLVSESTTVHLPTLLMSSQNVPVISTTLFIPPSVTEIPVKFSSPTTSQYVNKTTTYLPTTTEFSSTIGLTITTPYHKNTTSDLIAPMNHTTLRPTSTVNGFFVTRDNTTTSTLEPEIISDNVTVFLGTSTSSTSSTPSPFEGVDFRAVCGKRMFPEPRIVGGTKAAFGRWPWQISLRQWRTSTYLHKCGAALLNENWSITAAHCVDNVPPSDLLLRLGEYDLAEEEEPYGYQERRVQIVASHPQFDPRTFEYDLALLRFYEPVIFQPNIIPVCVPETDESFVGRTAFVTGWGRLYEDGPLPSVLQEVSVPVINNGICEDMYRSAGYIEHIPHIFICAGWKKGGYDSCEGDSGGPMVIQREDKRFLLAGVISWGIGCAEPNQPGVYTRISEFRDWINQILQF